MSPSSPPDEGTLSSVRQPHPLALRLIARLQRRGARGARIIDFAAGSGRNGEALRNAGFEVVAVGDEAAMNEAPLRAAQGTFDAAISTHGLLHGTVDAIAKRLELLAGRLEPDGLLFANFGSTRDARFGKGRRVAASTYVPLEGDERGVAHSYFNRAQLEQLLVPCYEVESLEEHVADAIAGRWAHMRAPLSKAVHWFLEARARQGNASPDLLIPPQ
jgi:Methyltransferase domain